VAHGACEFVDGSSDPGMVIPSCGQSSRIGSMDQNRKLQQTRSAAEKGEFC
jgi:hypothetical protein